MVFVGRTLGDISDETFPDSTAVLSRFQRVYPIFVCVEISNHTHGGGIRGPYREIYSRYSIDLHRVTTHNLVESLMSPLFEEIAIRLSPERYIVSHFSQLQPLIGYISSCASLWHLHRPPYTS